MKQIAFISALVFGTIFYVSAQVAPLKFSKDKTFKIVQFTDLHAIPGDKRSDPAFACMRNVLAVEKPDLVVVTGDIIYASPADENLRKVLRVIDSTQTPFVITFGNHDHEQGMSNAQLFKVAQEFKYFIGQTDEGAKGVGDCDIMVRSSDNKRNAVVLYCFDSRQYSGLKDVKGYNYIHLDQINRYVANSAKYTAENGGSPMAALAFFHIPLPEYRDASSNQDASLYGIRREKACSAELNSGMFAAMKECGDVMGTFVGHDHDNDYAVMWHGILLAYGRFSGGPTEYIHIPNGARVIEMHEGQRTFDTWIRLSNGAVELRTTYPDSYVK